ncbi:O-methyltransferase [Paludibaculum fermentans]|uniref:O-methyltransferase n=1 Tax=Paludibaculum fermentans TaxID=1473598 RepID=UPI003EBB157A
MRLLFVLGLLLVCPPLTSGWQPRLRRNPVTREDQTPSQPRTATEKLILSVLEEAVQADEVWANVPETDGRMLRLLAESTGAKNVVEIGTSTGLSGLWFCMALDRTHGHLTTFELDPRRAAIAQEHFRKAGVEKLVTIIQGDAHQNVKQLKLPIDIVFIDADKDGYLDYLTKLLPLVRPGGLILAHNVEMVPEYMKAIAARPELETVVYSQGGGLAVTLKKR